MSLKIFTFTFNRPDILELQYKSFKKNCENDFEFIVIHDSRNNQYVSEFEFICKKNNLKFYHHNSQPNKTANDYHSDVLCWTYNNIVNIEYIDDVCFFLDHDIFMVDKFDILKYIEDCDMASLFQRRPDPVDIPVPKKSTLITEDDNILYYCWPGFCIFKNEKIKNKNFDFRCKSKCELLELSENLRQDIDSGGGTYSLFWDKDLVIKNVGIDRIKDYKGFQITETPVTGGYDYEFMCETKFLHYRNACNWHSMFNIVDQDKTELLFKIFQDIN